MHHAKCLPSNQNYLCCLEADRNGKNYERSFMPNEEKYTNLEIRMDRSRSISFKILREKEGVFNSE